MKGKNIARIIYIILLSTFISHILQFLYAAIFTDLYILDGCGWGVVGDISLGCKMNVYFQPIGILLFSIFSNFIAMIISYKLIYNKKLNLTPIDRKKIYVTLEILLIIKLIMILPLTIIQPEFINIIQENNPVALVLPIVAIIGLFIVISWLLNKLIYQKQ